MKERKELEKRYGEIGNEYGEPVNTKVYVAKEADAVMDKYEDQLRARDDLIAKLRKQHEEDVQRLLENDKVHEGLEDQMEARIEELENSKFELLQKEDTQIAKLVGENVTKEARIKELEDLLDLDVVFRNQDANLRDLEERVIKYEARIKELEAENFKLKIKLGNKVVPSILNAKNEECLMERIEEGK